MNAPAEAFRCQALAKEIAAELRAKYDLKAWLAGQRVLITKFDHDPRVGSARHKRCSWPIGARQEQWLRAHPQATAAQAATLAPRPPFNARVETVTTKPFFRSLRCRSRICSILFCGIINVNW
jgi:putative SOS response-associated peptidase YedK